MIVCRLELPLLVEQSTTFVVCLQGMLKIGMVHSNVLSVLGGVICSHGEWWFTNGDKEDWCSS